MGRRVNGEGSVYQRTADGRWVGAVTLADGRRKVVYGRTKQLALSKLREVERAVDDGYPITTTPVTIAEYMETWLTATLPARVATGRLAASSLDSYTDNARKHIIPALGQIKLEKLTPAAVRVWMTGKLEEPSYRGRALSPRSVAYCHAILRAALSDAVREELVRRNVAQLVEPPRVRTPPVEPLTAEEAAAVLAAGRGEKLEAFWLVLLGLGLRRGEALGLHWADIDFERQTVKVSRSLQRLRGPKDPVTGKHRGKLAVCNTKTEASAAVLALPQFVTDALREHRQRQVAARLAAPVWIETEFVFTSSVGTPLEPRNVNRAWNELLDRAGVRRVKLHATRHTTASLLLREGVDMKIVQSVLRHSRLSTTADIYSHVYDEVKRNAAQRIDSLLGTAAPRAP